MTLFRIQKTSIIVILLSAALAIALGIAVWDINFWPTDTKVFYFDAAVKLPHTPYLSDIHKTVDDIKIRWLHGKELFILAASAAQRLINDFTTLRPFIIVCLLSVCLSSILIYFLARQYWGKPAGLVCYLLFITSAWPYVYILFAKHQPLGLAFFLLAQAVLLVKPASRWKGLLLVISGMGMGAALFSSTVSSLYVPYYFAGFLYFIFQSRQDGEGLPIHLLRLCISGLLIVLGVLFVFCYVNYPNIVYNIKSYIEYVQISGEHNHFYYNQPFLVQWFQDTNVESVRGGLEWIVKYFKVIMPVMFPVYVVTALCTALSAPFLRPFSRKWITLGLVALSVCPPVMAEIANVAQYGANYFPSIIGIIMLTGYAWHLLGSSQAWLRLNRWAKGLLLTIAGILFILHTYANWAMFAGDIYPTRMVTTFLSEKIDEIGAKKIYTYKEHPHRDPFVLYLSPKVKKKFRFVPMQYVIQPPREYILVPPATGDSIHIASISSYSDYSEDLFFNELLESGRIHDYTIVSFPTLANSEIWVHEEEILSYRKLILGHQFGQNELKGRVWLLDGAVLHNDKDRIIPAWDKLDMFQRKISNVGTVDKTNIYEGYTGKINKTKTLRNLLVWVYKVGNPTDAIRAFVYKVGADQAVLVPFSEHYISQPFSADLITYDTKKGAGFLKFDPPLLLEKGTYQFVIYRSGKPDDDNYYRIRNDYLGILDK